MTPDDITAEALARVLLAENQGGWTFSDGFQREHLDGLSDAIKDAVFDYLQPYVNLARQQIERDQREAARC